MAYGLTKSLDVESGSSQDASRADEAVLDITAELTFECWLKFESIPGTTQGVASKFGGTNHSWGIFYEDNAGTLRFRLNVYDSAAPTTNVNYPVNYTASADTWYHMAITYKGSTSTMELFINGVSIGTAVDTNANDINSSDSTFRIGNFAGSYFDGKISLARLWNDIRTGAEISANMCNVFAGAEANMVGEWSLNDVYTDASGNGLTLTANNAPVFATDVPSTCSATFKTKIIIM